MLATTEMIAKQNRRLWQGSKLWDIIVKFVTNNTKIFKDITLKVVILCFTKITSTCILRNIKEVLTFDQLIVKAPNGSKCVRLKGPKKPMIH